jgi:4-diphosphocytidyl-2-C-methyl-D-erythritol kinase
LWNLKLSPEDLKRLGLALGADVPFCLEGGFQRVRGIGEQMEALPAPPSPDILVVQMDEGLSTGEVFRSLERHPGDASDPEAAIEVLCRGDYAALGAHAANALTRAAIKLSPAVQSALILLSSRGALYARMTGSGSAVYGVFRGRAECLNAQRALGGRARCAIMTKTWPTGVDICG